MQDHAMQDHANAESRVIVKQASYQGAALAAPLSAETKIGALAPGGHDAQRSSD
jgi:hypothetical protein